MLKFAIIRINKGIQALLGVNMDLDTKINITQYNFEINRFWSSPEELPLKNVIGVIANKPTLKDIALICSEFGINTVKEVLSIMIRNHELGAAQVKRSNQYIKEFENHH